MSTSLVPATPSPRTSGRPPAERSGAGLFLLDAATLVAFLGLTFLLGLFPLKDTDFWWHLRTGDLVRETGSVPKVDIYTYAAEGKPWIDLHWVYQVVISWGYAFGGVPALTVGKAVITTFAVFLLLTARRRAWPLWVMASAWLPALLVLGGRMYVRPETLTLLYLSIYLAVLPRLDRRPWLAFLLPPVQVAWVNTQGLFVFGPLFFGWALLDYALRRGSFGADRHRWWRIVGTAAVLTGLACLINPYGLTGALYPLQLARTMGNPVFALNIAELTPIPEFIRRDGLTSLPLRLHLLTIVVGALSFLAPMVWAVLSRLRTPAEAPEPSPKAGKAGKGKSGAKPKRAKSKKANAAGAAVDTGWRLSVFRLLLFAALSFLSFQATRNSHQFAAVVGTVTAWNLGEWAAAVRQRSRKAGPEGPGHGLFPRLGALAAIGAVFIWVGSGQFYAACKEGRVIGLGEQPLWYPHGAVKFAGGTGMPPKFLGFHIGHASLYDYYYGPEKKVYVDARLEVIGPDLFERYMALQRRINEGSDAWPRELDSLGRPAVLADNELNAGISGTLLTSADWKCVWFDPIASVFVHSAYDQAVRAHQVDFAARHFRPDPATEPHGTDALLASARALRNVASMAMKAGPERVRPLVLLGLDHARRFTQADPSAADGWKMLGQLEMLRELPPKEPIPRFRLPFDPLFDLSAVRATFALNKALDAAPDDFSTLLMLKSSFEGRGMTEAVLPLLDRMTDLTPVNGMQARSQVEASLQAQGARNALGPPPPSSWQNLNELGRIVNDLLARGRAGTAAEYLERAAPAGSRSWDETDRIATLWLHLGEPARARNVWTQAVSPPRPALRHARIAVSHFAEGAFEPARLAYLEALAVEPRLFEALYGLAVLEQDAGRAVDSLDAARKAVAAAADDVSRQTAQAVVALVTPYAVPPVADRP